MAHHELKIEDEYYEAKVAGNKPFEIRYNDKGFQKGDTVGYTTVNALFKRVGKWEITYVISYQQKDNFVVFADKRIHER